jgi:hypothetical protein
VYVNSSRRAIWVVDDRKEKPRSWAPGLNFAE